MAPDAAGSFDVVIVGVVDRELDRRYLFVWEPEVRRRVTLLHVFSAEHKESDRCIIINRIPGPGTGRQTEVMEIQVVGDGITPPNY